MSGTSFINSTSSQQLEVPQTAENTIAIDKSVYSRLKLLANFYKKKPSDLVADAINHYLRLKKLDIDEALKNMVIGDEEE